LILAAVPGEGLWQPGAIIDSLLVPSDFPSHSFLFCGDKGAILGLNFSQMNRNIGAISTLICGYIGFTAINQPGIHDLSLILSLLYLTPTISPVLCGPSLRLPDPPLPSQISSFIGSPSHVFIA
jgi:hypothetical protein